MIQTLGLFVQAQVKSNDLNGDMKFTTYPRLLPIEINLLNHLVNSSKVLKIFFKNQLFEENFLLYKFCLIFTKTWLKSSTC